MEKPKGRVPFRIVLDNAPNAWGAWRGELTSPLLDPLLHPQDSVAVAFADLSPESMAGRLVLHAFQIDSLMEYLQRQSALRPALESELDRYLSRWDGAGRFARGVDVWNQVTVQALQLPLPAFPTPDTVEDDLAAMKRFPPPLSDEEARAFIASAAMPPPMTAFQLVLGADWGDAGKRLVKFQDGKVTDFIVES